ncbi:MAG: TetR/AcrR family transcriptional regulator [Sphingomonadales bacterium]
MPRKTDSRAKALATAEQLFRTQGYAATGLAQIIAESGSPKGSFYFHFPDGKLQMAQEALAAYAGRVAAFIQTLPAGTPPDAATLIQQLFAAIAAEMQAADHRLGCLVQNLAHEQVEPAGVLAAPLAEAIALWEAQLAARLVACGLAPAAARPRARAIILLLEGARTIARIERSDAAFTLAARLACADLDAAG